MSAVISPCGCYRYTLTRELSLGFGKRTGVAYAGEIEMTLLPPIETDGKTADDVMEILLETRKAIAEQLTVNSEQ